MLILPMLASDPGNVVAFLLVLPWVSLCHILAALLLNLKKDNVSRVFGGLSILISLLFLLSLETAREFMVQSTVALGTMGIVFGLFFAIARRSGAWRADVVINLIAIGCAAAPVIIGAAIASDLRIAQRIITPLVALSFLPGEFLAISAGLLQWPLAGYLIGRTLKRQSPILRSPEIWILIAIHVIGAVFATNVWS